MTRYASHRTERFGCQIPQFAALPPVDKLLLPLLLLQVTVSRRVEGWVDLGGWLYIRRCCCCSLLTFKVLIGIVLLGKAHQMIDDNSRSPVLLVKDVVDVKPVSKDDLDLLSSPTSADTSSLRRTQSLTQFLSATDDSVMVIYSLLLPLVYYYYTPPPSLQLVVVVVVVVVGVLFLSYLCVRPETL